MNKTDLLKMSLQNLWRRKTRTILTLLGVVIGTASIVIMLSLGIAMERGFSEEISNMGDLTIIHVDPYGMGFMMEEEPVRRQTKKPKLNDKAITEMKKIPGVEGVMPTNSIYLRLVSGKLVNDVQLVGVSPENMKIFGFKIEEGRALMVGDRDALVFGSDIAQGFRNPRIMEGGRAPLSTDVMLGDMLVTTDLTYGERRRPSEAGAQKEKTTKEYRVKGVGILEKSNAEKDYQVYTTLENLEKIKEEDEKSNRNFERGYGREEELHKYQGAQVKVKELDRVQEVQEQIKDMGFGAYSLGDILKSVQNTSRQIQAILGGIGAVSLLVAAIGITNTMIMSIYERTREIGVMKVIGAQLKDIKRLFLIEAGLIGLGGGILGLIFSYSVSAMLNSALGGAGMMGGGNTTGVSVIPWELALSGLLFSTLIGVIAGYSPARRAMRLSALDAIKNE